MSSASWGVWDVEAAVRLVEAAEDFGQVLVLDGGGDAGSGAGKARVGDALRHVGAVAEPEPHVLTTGQRATDVLGQPALDVDLVVLDHLVGDWNDLADFERSQHDLAERRICSADVGVLRQPVPQRTGRHPSPGAAMRRHKWHLVAGACAGGQHVGAELAERRVGLAEVVQLPGEQGRDRVTARGVCADAEGTELVVALHPVRLDRLELPVCPELEPDLAEAVVGVRLAAQPTEEGVVFRLFALGLVVLALRLRHVRLRPGFVDRLLVGGGPVGIGLDPGLDVDLLFELASLGLILIGVRLVTVELFAGLTREDLSVFVGGGQHGARRLDGLRALRQKLFDLGLGHYCTSGT